MVFDAREGLLLSKLVEMLEALEPSARKGLGIYKRNHKVDEAKVRGSSPMWVQQLLCMAKCLPGQHFKALEQTFALSGIGAALFMVSGWATSH